MPLYREPVYMMVSWDHPLVQKKGLKYDALEGMQFMYPHDTCCFVSEFLPMLAKMGVHLGKTTFWAQCSWSWSRCAKRAR